MKSTDAPLNLSRNSPWVSEKDALNRTVRGIDTYPHLDWLRFVLASIVVLSHAGVLNRGPIRGALAVDVFLALSGWLIGAILLRTAKSDLPRFFFNRATRIWIPYAGAVIVLYGVAALREGVSYNWLKYLFFDTTFTHYIFTHFPRAALEMPLKGTGNHFWSISVEEQFYLFSPIILVLLAYGKRIDVWLGIAFVLLLFGALATPISFGVIAALLQHRYGSWHLAPLARVVLIIAAMASLVLLGDSDPPAMLPASMFSVAVVLLCSRPGLRSHAGIFVGGVSYPLYLYHWLGGFIVTFVAKHTFTIFPLVAETLSYLMAVVIATAAYYAVDRRVMNLRNDWFSDRAGKLVAAIAYGLLVLGLVGGVLWS